MADLTGLQASEAVRILGSDNTGAEQTPVQSTSNGALHLNLRNESGVEIGTNANPVKQSGTGAAGTPDTGVVTVQGIQGAVAQKTVPTAPYASNSYPNPIQAYPDPEAQSYANDYPLNADAYGNLQVRGPVITDEASSRNDFSGSTLESSLTGSVKFMNNSTEVTGIGTSFTTEVRSGWYIRRTAGTDTEYVQVDYVQDDTTLYLVANYSGNYNNVPAIISEYQPVVVGAASYTVNNSLLNLTPGTTNGASVSITNQGDYLPFNLQFAASISQRIANQTALVGFRDSLTSPTKQAVVVFDGTTSSTVKFITASSSAAADTQTSTVSIPTTAALPTASSANENTYQIDLVGQQASLSINGILVATHTLHLPGPYDSLKVIAHISNTAVVTATTFAINYLYFSNQNRLNIGNDFQSDPISSVLFGKTSAGSIKEMLVGTSGENLAVDYNTTKATYSATIVGLSTANNATDIFTLTGSASKTIKVKNIAISGTRTSATATDILLVKRSTANTGGTSTTPAPVPLDSSSTAATAVVRAYTTNPTLGTAVGTVKAVKLFMPTTSGSPVLLDWRSGDFAQPVTLRGTAEVLSVNLNATTVGGASFNIFIEWIEE
jgi:hypothetical protein